MFGRDVGKTLKVLANIIVWLITGLGAIASLLVVVLVMMTGRGMTPVAAVGAVLIVVVMTALSFGIGWLTSVMLYAFGNLVSNTQKISEDLDFLCVAKEDEIAAAEQARTRMAQMNAAPAPAKPRAQAVGWKCVHCGAMNSIQTNVCSACHKAPEGV